MVADQLTELILFSLAKSVPQGNSCPFRLNSVSDEKRGRVRAESETLFKGRFCAIAATVNPG